MIEKCRALTAEIATNASKIHTALRLSVQDQTSISLLKKELDKAWQIVSDSSKREKRAKETIQRLQDDIQRLSLLVDQGAGLSIGQENAVNELLKLKEHLQSEIEKHLMTNKQLQVQVDELTALRDQLQDRNEELLNQNRRLLEEKKDLQAQIAREKSQHAATQQDLKDTLARLKRTEEEQQARSESQIKQIRDLTNSLNDFRSVEKKRDELKQTVDRLSAEKATLEERLKDTVEGQRRLREEKTRVEAELAAKNKELEQSNQRNLRLENEKRKLEDERLSLQQQLERGEQYKKWLKKQMKSVLMSVEAQRRDADVDEAMIKELNQHIKKLKRSLELANQTNIDQYQLVADSEVIKKSLEEDLLAQKVEEQQLRKRAYQLEKEKEAANMKATQYRHMIEELKELLKTKDMHINELSKQIVDEQNKFRLQRNLYEQLRSDRNKFSKQQAQQRDDIAEMHRRFKIMAHQIEQLKEEIQNKDNALINEHFAYKRMQAEMKVARRKLAKRKEVLASADQVLMAQDAEIKALRRQIIEAEIAHHNQERAYEELMQERDILGTQLIRRNDELALLYEKIRLQQSTLSKGEIQYRMRLQDLRALKIAINNLKQELQLRSQEVTTVEALKNEVYHIQRELLQERTKVKALSEELENPMNVHRWRGLEGSDPKKYELIQKVQMLQRRLIAKTEEAVAKDMKLEEKEKLYQALKALVARQPGPELAEQLSMYQNSLKDKTRQMKALAAELNMFQAQANEYRYEVDKMTRENQDVKRRLFEQRKQEQALRIALSGGKPRALPLRTTDPLILQQRAFFANHPKIVGGGFNLTSTVPSRAIRSTVPAAAGQGPTMLAVDDQQQQQQQQQQGQQSYRQ